MNLKLLCVSGQLNQARALICHWVKLFLLLLNNTHYSAFQKSKSRSYSFNLVLGWCALFYKALLVSTAVNDREK